MKKLFSVFLTVLILLSAFFSVDVFATDTVELKLSDATVYAGDEFEVKLFISDNSKLSGAVIDIKYDTDVLEFVSAEKGAILDENASVSLKNFNDKEYIRFTYMAPSSSVTSEGILFSIRFKALSTAEGVSTLEISIPNAGDFVNSDLEKLSYTVKNSNVKVINTTFDGGSTTAEDSTVALETDVNESTSTDIELTTGDNKSTTDDADNLKVVIGLFVAGGVIIIGAVIYLIVSKKKRGN